MAETLTRSNQITHIDATPALGNLGNQKLQDIINDININTDAPLRMYAANPPDSKLYFSSSRVLSSDGAARSVPAIKKQVPVFPLSSIDFQTGAVSGGTIDISFPTSTSGQFRRVGFTYITGGTIQAIFSNSSSSIAGLQDPGELFVNGGIPIGWIDLESTGGTSYKTAGSSASVIENNVGGSPRIFRISAGGGVGGGESMAAGVQPASGFKVVIVDNLNEFPNSPSSKIDPNFTNATFDVAKELYRLQCDKSKTVTTLGTSYTLSGAPSYTVKPGDIIFSGSEFRRIATVTSSTTGTLDSPFTLNLSSASCMVGQAVWTKDLVNVGDATQLTRLRDIFPSKAVKEINVNYLDSIASGDDVPDFTAQASIVVSACSAGAATSTGMPNSSAFTIYFQRPSASNDVPNIVLNTFTPQERLFLCFFPNPSNASVVNSCNLLRYECSLYQPDTIVNNGGYINSAYCYADGSGPAVGCLNPFVVGGKTRVQLNWYYIPGLNGGMPNGDLEVVVEGDEIPRDYGGTVGSYYKEIDSRTIELWTDISSLPWSIHIKRRQGSKDYSNENSYKLSAMYQAIVGSSLQVTNGIATHTSINAAIAAVNDGDSILVLKGQYTESVNVNRVCRIQGQGNNTVIVGNLTISTDRSTVKDLRVDGNIILTGNGNIAVDLFQSTTGTVNDTGTDNLYYGVRY